MANMGCGQDLLGDIRLDLEKTEAANILGDIQQLPFKDECFSEVHCISVLEHVSDWKLALKELCRVTGHTLVIEVPVNSDLRKTDVFRLLLPTPRNIRLFFSIPERARQTKWQFDPYVLYYSLLNLGFFANWGKVIQFYAGMPSRCWRFSAWRIRRLIE